MRRGEVWLVKLDPTIGAEIGKTRPAAIVNDDEVGILPLKVIVPITEWQDRYSDREWMVQVEPSIKNGLNKLLAADTFQLSCISIERFVRQLGILSDTAMQEVSDALAIVLSIY